MLTLVVGAEGKTRMPAIKKPDIRNALKASPDPRTQALADEIETVNSVWRVLNTSAELIAEAQAHGGRVSGRDAAMSLGKKAVAVASLGGDARTAAAVKAATMLGGQMLATAEIGKALSLTPGRASAIITLKVAEKVVSAAGLGNVDKCRLALASLTVNAGTGVFTCVATGGALCFLAAAAFALEAFNTSAQCSLPPPGAAG